MNKQEAADYLGVSVRALERYVQQGKISVRYEKGKTRPTANFDPTELETFKVELEQPTIKPAFESRQITTEQQSDTGKLTHNAGEIAKFDEVSTFGEIGVIEKLSGIIEALLGKADNQPLVPIADKLLLTIADKLLLTIADKLLLTIAEVQALTGLSREFLRDAIASGDLKAKQIGKSWRVKRSDLQEYVDKLF